ncbi:MAG TPA: hypothetical protein VIU64_22800, partial [Polyangia bacterium]
AGRADALAATPDLAAARVALLERAQVILQPRETEAAQRGRAVFGTGRQKTIPPSTSSGQVASQTSPQSGHCLSSSHSASSTTGHCITESSSTRAHPARV